MKGLQLFVFFLISTSSVIAGTNLSLDEIDLGLYACKSIYVESSGPTSEELKKILEDHAIWLKSKAKEDISGGASLCHADLSYADLTGANLSHVDLSYADLSYSNLVNTNLSYANLSDADLRESDLSDASLIGANLSGAILKRAKLIGADLSKTNLSWNDLSNVDLSYVNLSKANLSSANLSHADLFGANLSYADLSETDLSYAFLYSADLSGVKLINSKLIEADLSEAKLINAQLINASLSNAKFTNVDLRNAHFEPTSNPNKIFLNGIKNLSTVQFNEGKQSGLIILRNNLKEGGFRKLERDVTYAIEKGKTNHNLSQLEQFFRRLFFEYTVGYGLYPKRNYPLPSKEIHQPAPSE